MLLQENAQLVDESSLSMVFELRFDVTPYVILMIGADGEGGITLLPCELRVVMNTCTRL